MVANSKRMMCTSIEEDLNICKILINLKNPVLHKKPIQLACRRKRNTLRRKRSNFDSLCCWSTIKPRRRVSGRLLANCYHKKQQSKQVAERNFGKQYAKKGKKRQTSIKSYSRMNFDLQQLFGATDAEEIKRRSAVDDFSAQGRFPLAERQQGWIIETRTRGCRKDKFFRHEKTNLLFRSMIQVEAFIRNHTPPKERGKPSKHPFMARRKKTYRSSARVNLLISGEMA